MSVKYPVLFAFAAFIAFAAVFPASADCTTSDTTATCTGDLSSEVSYGSGTGVDTVVIEDLTSDFALVSGSVVKLHHTGSNGADTGDAGNSTSDLSVTFDGGDYGVTGVTQDGFEVISAGGAGATGEAVSTTETPAGASGVGGAGSDVSLEMTSGFFDYDQTDGNTGADGFYGIYVMSEGGNGGEGGESSVGTDEDFFHITSGTGGKGGDAGSATVTLNGLGNSDGSAGYLASFAEDQDPDTTGIGIRITSLGGGGGMGGFLHCNNDYNTGNPTCGASSGEGGGGTGGPASLTVSDMEASIADFPTNGFLIESDGGKGGLGKYFWAVNGENIGDYGRGGDGGDAAAAALVLDNSTVTVSDSTGAAAEGIIVTSAGGDAGDGSDLETRSSPATCQQGYGACYPSFGNGGDGGEASLSLAASDLTVAVSADGAPAILIESTGGAGSTIGTAQEAWDSNSWDWTDDARPDTTANGGDAGTVSVTMDSTSTLTVSTSGDGSVVDFGALMLLSIGGEGPNGVTDIFAALRVPVVQAATAAL